MHITVLNGSPRPAGNTEIMADAFIKGASEKGHTVVKINLAGKKVSGCLGCQKCFTAEGVCVQKDDMAQILDVLDQTDMVVFASPVYWFDITAQLKCVIDRMYARAVKGFHFNKVALLLDSCSEGVYDAAITQYKAMNAYLRWEDQGIITIAGMEAKGDMKDAPKLASVCELGRSL